MRLLKISTFFLTAVAISFLPPTVWDNAEEVLRYTAFDARVFRITSTMAGITACIMLIQYFVHITKD